MAALLGDRGGSCNVLERVGDADGGAVVSLRLGCVHQGTRGAARASTSDREGAQDFKAAWQDVVGAAVRTAELVKEAHAFLREADAEAYEEPTEINRNDMNL